MLRLLKVNENYLKKIFMFWNMRDFDAFKNFVQKSPNLTNMLHICYIYVKYVSFMKHLKKGELLWNTLKI